MTEWEFDFVKQAHISNARNWMTAVCQKIKEVVRFERCKSGEFYENWENRPVPQCAKCKKAQAGKLSHCNEKSASTEMGESGSKRAHDQTKNSTDSARIAGEALVEAAVVLVVKKFMAVTAVAKVTRGSAVVVLKDSRKGTAIHSLGKWQRGRRKCCLTALRC